MRVIHRGKEGERQCANQVEAVSPPREGGRVLCVLLLLSYFGWASKKCTFRRLIPRIIYLSYDVVQTSEWQEHRIYPSDWHFSRGEN